MKKTDVYEIGKALWESVPGNLLRGDMPGIGPEYADMRLWDAPLIGFVKAEDPLFAEFKRPGVIVPWHMSPRE